MESSNPVFGRKEFSRQGYATFGSSPATASAGELQDMYDAPSATSLQTGRMTIDDVVMRTATLFGILLVTGGITFFYLKPQSLGLILGAALVGFVLAMVVSFSKTVRPPLIMAYAAVEGVFVGGLSFLYNETWPGIVFQAVLGTLLAFGAMLALYRTGVIKATPRFTRILMIAGAGYLAFALINLVVSLVAGHNAYFTPFGFVIAGLGVALASLFLVLDFNQIEQGIRNGAPQQFAWVAAFGLVVTLVWLYLEMLRLLRKIQDRR